MNNYIIIEIFILGCVYLLLVLSKLINFCLQIKHVSARIQIAKSQLFIYCIKCHDSDASNERKFFVEFSLKNQAAKMTLTTQKWPKKQVWTSMHI